MKEFHIPHGGETQPAFYADSKVSTANQKMCSKYQPDADTNYSWNCTRPFGHTGGHEHHFFGGVYGRWYETSDEL